MISTRSASSGRAGSSAATDSSGPIVSTAATTSRSHSERAAPFPRLVVERAPRGKQPEGERCEQQSDQQASADEDPPHAPASQRAEGESGGDGEEDERCNVLLGVSELSGRNVGDEAERAEEHQRKLEARLQNGQEEQRCEQEQQPFVVLSREEITDDLERVGQHAPT